jgi:hypothetical protein
MCGNNMKKLFGVFVLGLFVISMMAGLVSAQANDPVDAVQKGVASGYELIRPVLEGIIGETSDGEFFLAKVLLLMIIFAILWVALDKVSFFSENTWVLVIVSVAVSILSIRWFGNSDMIRTVILPYSALGIAISAGLPFVLAFIIIENNFKKTMRKIGWIFFAVVFVGLWIMRSGESGAEAVGGPVGPFAWIYLATAGIAMIMLFMDGTIQRTMAKSSVERIQSAHTNKMAGELRDEMKKFTVRYKDEGDKYVSVYQTNKKGHEGWKADMEAIKKSIGTLKSE